MLKSSEEAFAQAEQNGINMSMHWLRPASHAVQHDAVQPLPVEGGQISEFLS